MMSEHGKYARLGLAALAVSSMLAASCGGSNSGPTGPSAADPVSAVGAGAGAAQVLGKGGNGNGAPSGSHYNLNIIGVPRDKSADMTGNQGHVIFVKLSGNTKINLAEGDDFQVLDANGTDGEAAFQLPNPDPDGDGVTTYSVFARALGTPGGSATIMTCADDPDLGLVCSTEQVVLVRDGRKASFRNVSRELLYIYADIGEGAQLYPLFGDELENYFWSYDNAGLKLAQLRFYPCSTDVVSGNGCGIVY